MSAPDTTYTLDSRGIIIAVSDSWDRFAAENDGEGAMADQVIGRPIWDFVTGEATRMWLEAIMQLARVRNEVIERPYRCDSPGLQRFMQVRVRPTDDGCLEFEHEILATRKREPRLPMFHDPGSPSPPVFYRCSICNLLKDGEDWIEPTSRHLQTHRGIPVIYTVCRACRQDG